MAVLELPTLIVGASSTWCEYTRVFGADVVVPTELEGSFHYLIAYFEHLSCFPSIFDTTAALVDGPLYFTMPPTIGRSATLYDAGSS